MNTSIISIEIIIIFCFRFHLQEKTQIEMDDFKKRLEISVDRLNGQTDESDKLIKTLNARIDALQQELNDVRNLLEK